MNKRLALSTVAFACLCHSAPSLAQTHTVTATGETQEFSDGFGSLRTATLEYKFVNQDTTVVITPAIGERRAPGVSETAVGGGATLYQNWSDTFSTRTSVFFSENEPVFAQHDFAQDLTAKIGDSTTVTVGGRLAQYFGNRDVVTLSGGARQYFRGGSVAYRLSLIDPEGRDSYLAHLVNLSLNDARGAGRTRLWLSAGDAALTAAQVPDNFSGDDYAAVLQRIQPLSDRIALVPSIGYTSYDRPGGRIDAFSVGLGVALTVD